MKIDWWSVWFAVVVPALCGAATYEVGPGKALTRIGDVPWESLNAGDQVLIHWRPQAYKEKWVICVAGTAENPVIVRGVPGPGGRLPVIDGKDAVTRSDLNFWNEDRGVIKIGGANTPEGVTPSHIVVENLEVRGARSGHQYVGRKGRKAYRKNAAAIYVEFGSHFTIRNCTLTDSGNGLLTRGNRILVDGCRIYGNGNVGSITEHNVYTGSGGTTFQNNWLGPLLPGARGNNLKDRSAGLVVRHNWIEGGNRQLDLVDAEDDDGLLSRHPEWGDTFVYGNVLVEHDDKENRQIVHYGGDMGNEAWYRRGTLHFYHNTVVSQRSGRTTLFRLSSAGQHVDCRNNVFVASGRRGRLIVAEGDGRVDLWNNYLSPNFLDGNARLLKKGLVADVVRPGLEGLETGDYRLSANSTCRGKAGPLAEAAAQKHPVKRRYVQHQRSEPRQAPQDLGAL